MTITEHRDLTQYHVASPGDVARLYSVVEDETFVGDVVKVTDTYAAVRWRKSGLVERFPFYVRSSITFEPANAGQYREQTPGLAGAAHCPPAGPVNVGPKPGGPTHPRPTGPSRAVPPDTQTPARQAPSKAAVVLSGATPGEPVQPPVPTTGECRTPGSAAAVVAVRESPVNMLVTGAGVVDPSDEGRGRASGRADLNAPVQIGGSVEGGPALDAGAPWFLVGTAWYDRIPLGVGPLYDVLPRRP